MAAAMPRRWVHVQAVAAKTSRLRAIVGPDEDVLTAAAYLHDIGYAPDLVDTGLHSIDGARHLRALGAPRRVVNLVARHSLAYADAEREGLSHALNEFDDEPGLVRDLLWFCDMTTGPDGQTLRVRERIVEVCDRYGWDSGKARTRLATARERFGVEVRVRSVLRQAGLDPDTLAAAGAPAGCWSY